MIRSPGTAVTAARLATGPAVGAAPGADELGLVRQHLRAVQTMTAVTSSRMKKGAGWKAKSVVSKAKSTSCVEAFGARGEESSVP